MFGLRKNLNFRVPFRHWIPLTIAQLSTTSCTLENCMYYSNSRKSFCLSIHEHTIRRTRTNYVTKNDFAMDNKS